MDSQSNIVEFTPNDETARRLRDAFGCFATGVTIITVATPDGPVNITANSFSSVSMDPPLVLWSVDKSSKRAPYFLNANHFAIHILEEGQGDLCWRSSKDMRGLRPDDYTQNAQGVPLLHGCLARFECSQYAMHDAGDHHIIIGRVHHVSMNTQAGGLGFFRGKLGRFSAQE